MVQFVKKNVSSSKLSSSFISRFLEMQEEHGSSVALNSTRKLAEKTSN
ncbi:DEHA2D00286p [Debaryomyces hansenii CBS767]|uniref:DEHA2D00286p n=1 Tax=Debaryomyces hansenii (strain ATCC 36239 / CBS 767 / BCRC 21394 / JCM 1990 / NBRC 0083 / IGC 2968) TaxID=284592 RepID=Q6BTI7_DEBHA|nr:DEHA2D00286p [Debaryomyces hansenii CBS767]CAG86578.1 DEHA2D00286p [Debaryomyces hansenii CBS767]|eukprot:XP_458482.1 DEHA2D00286p [Debaryomyces hansenii CBS767]